MGLRGSQQARRRLGERALGGTAQAGCAQGLQVAGGRWAQASGSRRRCAELAGRAAAGAAGVRGALGARQQGQQGRAGRAAWALGAASAHLGVLSWARLGFCAL